MVVQLAPVSYSIPEVRVESCKDIFDPLIFPKHLPEAEQIELNLPSYYGSRIK